MTRLGRVLLVTSLALLALAPPALAAGTVSLNGSTATFSGTSGPDTVTVYTDATYVYFSGPGVSAGTGCAPDAQADTVRCSRDTLQRLDLEMGAGADSATNTTGYPATFNGGAGDDQYDGGGGALPDDVHGGPGIDTVRYDTSHLNLTITLDDVANDGAPNAGANIHSDVEDVTAGSGDDRLVGDDANNRLEGGPGNDTIIGNEGIDALIGGPGNDSIYAADGSPDTVDCGDGVDGASTDRHDTRVDCENSHPAALTTVRARVTHRFKVGARTTVQKLVVTHVPAASAIRLTCGGRRKGCPFTVADPPTRPGSNALTGLFRRAKLGPGAKLEIRVVTANKIGRVFRFTIRRRRAPRAETLCLLPGAKRPSACP